MVLSALVRDMVMSELELGMFRTGLCGAQPAGSTYIHRVQVGARLWGLAVGPLIRSSDNGQSEPGGTSGVRGYHPCHPSWVLEGALVTA